MGVGGRDMGVGGRDMGWGRGERKGGGVRGEWGKGERGERVPKDRLGKL